MKRSYRRYFNYRVYSRCYYNRLIIKYYFINFFLIRLQYECFNVFIYLSLIVNETI